jgi:4-amino-4-deoxy-L-arabinose transferase-like glycosyltransferase
MLVLDRQAVAARPAPWHRTSAGRTTGAVLLAALVGCLALRLPYFRLPLGIDEGGVAFIARAWGSGHGSLYGAYWLDRPPMLVALYKVAVLGGATGVRILGAVAALSLVAITTVVARALAGDRGARVAAVVCAPLASSVALAAVYTPAELLAAVPAVASVGCLVAADRRRAVRWLVPAGALAVAAALIKQSFLDAGLAGAVFLLATLVRQRRGALRSLAAYGAGVVIALLPVAAWLGLAHLRVSELTYALFGFRVRALETLAASRVPLQARVHDLLLPAAGSGLLLAGVVAVAGLWAIRRERVLAPTLVAWVAGATVGVLGGGTYWPHYLIQLAAPASILAGCALASVPRAARLATAGAIAAIAVTVTVAGVSHARANPAQHSVVAVARWMRAHERPGDTQYVLYARANVGYYSALRSPYPYAWSLMMRAVPGAAARLLGLLRSPQRPTWIVQWQDPSAWGLDPHGAIRHALRTRYRLVARVHGHPIFRRR